MNRTPELDKKFDWYFKEPELNDFYVMMLQHFNRLSSTRINANAIGCISWMTAYEYSGIFDWKETTRAAFADIIINIDSEYVKYHTEKMTKASKPVDTGNVKTIKGKSKHG